MLRIVRLNISWAILVSLAVAIIALLRLAALSRLVPAYDFGLFAVYSTASLFIVTIAQGLVSTPFLSKREIANQRSMVYSYGFVALAVAGAAAVLFLLSISWGWLIIDWRSSTLIVLGTTMRMAALVPVARLQANGRYGGEFSLQVVPPLVGLIASVVAAAYSPNFIALFLGFAAEGFVLALLSIISLWRDKPQESHVRLAWSDIKGSLAYAATFSTVRLNQFTITALVAHLLGEEAAGYLNRAQSLHEAISSVLVGNSVNRLLRIFPIAKQNGQLRNLYQFGIEVTSTSAAIISVFVAIGAVRITSITLGSGWSSTASLLAVLSLSLVPRLGYKVSEFVSYTTNLSHKTAVRGFVNVLIGSSCVMLSYKLGLFAVCWALVAAQYLNYMASNFIVLQSLDMNVREFLSMHRRALAWSVGSFLVYQIIRSILDSPVSLWISASAIGLMYLASWAKLRWLVVDRGTYDKLSSLHQSGASQ